MPFMPVSRALAARAVRVRAAPKVSAREARAGGVEFVRKLLARLAHVVRAPARACVSFSSFVAPAAPREGSSRKRPRQTPGHNPSRPADYGWQQPGFRGLQEPVRHRRRGKLQGRERWLTCRALCDQLL